jgi:hypothetical protein
MIDAMTSAIIQGAINGDIMDTLDAACDHCRAEAPTLSSVQNLLIFPDISADQGKIIVFRRKWCHFPCIDVIVNPSTTPDPKIDPTHAQMDKLTLNYCLGGFSQEKLNVFMSNICGAVNCRDKVAQCADMISRQMDCSSNWMQNNCANSCGCQPKPACPPIVTEDLIEAVIEEDEEADAEHNDALMQDISIADALRLLDPTTTLGQFDTDVRATLQV